MYLSTSSSAPGRRSFRNVLFSAALPAHPDIVPIPPLILPMPVVPPA